jgi:hypothetical protein
LSTTFLVTQAQRDLLQANVNLLQTTLDYETSLINFEAVQQAPAGVGDNVSPVSQPILPVGPDNPRGIFRTGVGATFQ